MKAQSRHRSLHSRERTTTLPVSSLYMFPTPVKSIRHQIIIWLHPRRCNSKHILIPAAKVLQMVSRRNTVWPQSTRAKMWLMSQICIIYIKHLHGCKCGCELENGYGSKRGERWKSSWLTLNHLKHGRSPSFVLSGLEWGLCRINI